MIDRLSASPYSLIRPNPIAKLNVLLDARTWFLIAIFFAPLRAYGQNTFIGNFSLFRLFSLAGLYLLVLQCLSRYPFANSRGRRIGITYALTNAFFVLLIFTVLPENLDWQGASTMALIKLIGWLWVTFTIFMFNDRLQVYKMVKVYIFSSIFPVIIGWYQCFSFYVEGRIAQLPFSSFVFMGDKTLGVQYWKYYRPTSTFLEPNYYAYFLTIVILLCLVQVMTNRYFVQKILTLVILFACMGQLLFTLSLTGLIGFVVGFTVMLVIISKKAFLKVVVYLAILSASLFLLVNIIPLISNTVEGIRLRIIIRGEQSTTLYGRGEMVNAALQATMDSYGLGAGFGGIHTADTLIKSTAHSALLTVLAEQGILPFMVLVLGIFWVIKQLYRLFQANAETSEIYLGLLAGVISLVFSNFGYDAMFKFDASWALFGVSMSAATMPILKPLSANFENDKMIKVGNVSNT